MFFKKSSSVKSKSIMKNVLVHDSYIDKSYIFKNDSFNALKKLTFNTSNFVTSYMNNKDMIITTIKLSRSIPDEDIEDIIEIKAYEELGLDQAINYFISSYEVETDAEEREFHLFVVISEHLDELYLPVKEETKYLDLIVPAPLLYKALYKQEILDINGIHCFVYFTDNDAFITFYKNGEYLYSKSIDFSIDQIYDKYCEFLGEPVDKKDFLTILESEGLKATDEIYQQNFMKIFSEVFININDIAIYAKRAFELDTIDHMFIGSSRGPIIGLDDYSQNYLGLQSSELNFDFDMKNDEQYTDQFQYLMLLSSLHHIEEGSSTVNLTIFPRPPSFMNRTSGQFIIATFAAISAGLAYPLVYLLGSYTNDAKIYALGIQNSELKAEVSKYKKILSDKKLKISGLDKNIERLLTKYNAKTNTLEAIYEKKVNYNLKSGRLHVIADELNKFDVYVDLIYTNNDIAWMSLVSTDDRKFTELIKYISDTHFDRINQIDIERMEKDINNNYYRGILKVDLK